MIPKVIHYCWFGRNPLPPLAKKCIASWKKYLPDYEIKEWNEDNFDVNMLPYTKEAYEAKKYAFVSDFARFWILYNYGGIYFDTDVEVIKNMDHIISQGDFMGCEFDITIGHKDIRVAPGLGMGAEPKRHIYKELLDIYSTIHFILPDGTLNKKTIVLYTTEIFEKWGLVNNGKIQNLADTFIYPCEYFCPRPDEKGKLQITSKTVSIHHYAGSWLDTDIKIKKIIIQILGHNLTQKIVFIKKLFRKALNR